MPDSLKVVIAASTIAAGAAVFSSILLTRCFLNYRNCSSNCVTWCGSNTFTV